MLAAIALLATVVVPSEDAVEHWRKKAGAYTLTFHPGFVSRASVEEPSGETVELYRQEGSFETHGKVATKHQIRLWGPEPGEVALVLHDPRREIVRVRVVMRSPEGPRTLVIEDGANTCPPYCDVKWPLDITMTYVEPDDAEKAVCREVRIAGGPHRRDLTIGVIDDEHQIVRISLDLTAAETFDIDSDELLR